MTLRTKSEQRAYLDGYEMCAENIEKYLSDKGKKVLESLLVSVRNAVDIEEPKGEQNHCIDCKHFKGVKWNQKGGWYGFCKIKKHYKDEDCRRSGRNPACKSFEAEANE